MATDIEFLFDFVSPTTYLAHKRMAGIAERTGARIIYRPIFLGAVMKATGNTPPGMVPAKGAYLLRDLQRFAERDSIPFQFNPNFPMNTLPLLRIAAALEGSDELAPFVDAVFTAAWSDAKNVGDLEIAAAVMDDAGLQSSKIMPLAELQEAKDRLKENTDYGVSKGMFGVPSFVVGNELFFGQDRTDFVEMYALR